MQRLPLGIQTFSKIRKYGDLYVDKTALIYELAKMQNAVFLSRPRRFGKSLTCSTLRSLFEGKRELFKDLAIDNSDWEWAEYPVVHIDLNAGNFERGIEPLDNWIRSGLQFSADDYKVPLIGNDNPERFKNLLKSLYEKYKSQVVVIIDEYDKPLLNTLDNPELHKQILATLKSFYGVLKSSDSFLRFAFITGVTKFAHTSIFSDLNQLKDISLNPKFAELCGITQKEIDRYFPDRIDYCLQELKYFNGDKKKYLNKLKRFYNGYKFSKGLTSVYNPVSLLNHFDEAEFRNFWFETGGTPTFLIRLIKEQKINILDLDKENVSSIEFGKFDMENMLAVPVLYQSGYLTIKDYDEKRNIYSLGYPNDEIKASFSDVLADKFANIKSSKSGLWIVEIADALDECNIEKFIEKLRPFYNSIPYEFFSQVEYYYELVFYLILRMLSIHCAVELHTAIGRIDSVVEVDDYIYCIEFKRSGTAQDALNQINDKDYCLSFENEDSKKIVKIGIAFDDEKRNIGEWKVEK
ncbi:ATPase AAA [Fibrobacterales bacterium]|nr:ATPase AAA [Fibrobacterales bacterium]